MWAQVWKLMSKYIVSDGFAKDWGIVADGNHSIPVDNDALDLQLQDGFNSKVPPPPPPPPPFPTHTPI